MVTRDYMVRAALSCRTTMTYAFCKALGIDPNMRKDVAPKPKKRKWRKRGRRMTEREFRELATPTPHCMLKKRDGDE